jgi:hypothetical protein
VFVRIVTVKQRSEALNLFSAPEKVPDKVPDIVPQKGSGKVEHRQLNKWRYN